MTSPDDIQSGALPRVLVADDNDVCRDIVVSILEGMGCRVDNVSDGVAAVRAARRTRYDLIFLDGIMPEMDGIETAREIRRLPGENGRVPIVGITGNPVQIPKARCLEVGMNEYLQKPIGRDAYQQVVARWLPGLPEPACRR